MSKTNAEWRGKDGMPKNPTETQRVEWHLEHAINCGCRDISKQVFFLGKSFGRDQEERNKILPLDDPDEVLQHPQPDQAAFLRVELHTN